MPTLLESAEMSARFPDQSNYMQTVDTVLRDQRIGKINPLEIENPFERVFSVDETKSENGCIVWNIPSLDDSEKHEFQMVLEFQTGRIPSWANRSIHSVQINNHQGIRVLDLLNPRPHSILLDTNGRFASGYQSDQIVISWMDSFPSIYGFGHERAHLRDTSLDTPEVLRGVLKQYIYDMAVNKNVGIPFWGGTDPTEKVKENLLFNQKKTIAKAKVTIDQLINDPLTESEANGLIESEVYATQGGITQMVDILDTIGTPMPALQSIVESATIYAIDGLSTYVRFAKNHVGGNFYDWLSANQS